MKKILIISDSLGLPRSEPQVVELEETWPELIVAGIPDTKLIRLSLGGGLIAELYRQSKYYHSINPDVIIIQSGIVDCAPRSLKKNELNFIIESRVLSRLLLPVIKKNGSTIRKFRNVVYTPQDDFKRYAGLFAKTFGEEKVYWIGIAPALAAYEKKLPGITASISSYNAILKGLFEAHFVDISDMPETGIMSDFHHLTAEGNAYVAKKIIKLLQNQ